MFLRCVECDREMECLKIGLRTTINQGRDIVHYDLYECPSCLIKVRANFGRPYPKPVRDMR